MARQVHTSNDTPPESKVYFEKLIKFELIPPKAEPVDRSDLTQQQIAALCVEYRKEGFNDRAIIVRRLKYNHQMENPQNWGIVTDLRTWKSINQPYAPLKCKWFSGYTSDEWKEDLILIFPALSSRTMAELIERQISEDEYD